MLQCDVCGGSLTMQVGGQQAVCDVCGVKYSVERLREKIQSANMEPMSAETQQKWIQNSDSDLSQWRKLIYKYYAAGDFLATEKIVKKILEAYPDDVEANKQYDELQILKHLEIKDGVLVKYNGKAETLVLPDCIKKIGDEAFSGNDTLKEIIIPNGVKEIGNSAFYNCYSLAKISIPDTIETIGICAFCSTALVEIHIPTGVKNIGSKAFCYCKSLKYVDIPKELVTDEVFCTHEFDKHDRWVYSTEYASPWYKAIKEERQIEQARVQEEQRRQHEAQVRQWKGAGLCQHCGNRFVGIFSSKCSKCGKLKDY